MLSQRMPSLTLFQSVHFSVFISSFGVSWQTIKNVNVKSFPSLKAHRAALISVLLARSQTPVFTLRDRGYGASVSRGVPVYVPAVKPVPNYTAWWQRHMCVNNLPKVITRQCPSAKSNLRLWVTSGLQVRHVTVRPPSHTMAWQTRDAINTVKKSRITCPFRRVHHSLQGRCPPYILRTSFPLTESEVL